MNSRARSLVRAVRESSPRPYAARADALMSAVEKIRRDVALQLDPRRRALYGQFLTPAPVAEFIAKMARADRQVLRVLDPGAGVGSLSAALIAAICRRTTRPESIALTAYE